MFSYKQGNPCGSVSVKRPFPEIDVTTDVKKAFLYSITIFYLVCIFLPTSFSSYNTNCDRFITHAFEVNNISEFDNPETQ